MSNGRDIVFWQNALSIHQAPVIAAVAEYAARRVTVVAPEAVSADRRQLGWPVPDFGGAELVVAPDANRIRKLASDREAVHIFTGWRRLRFATDPTAMLRKHQCPYGFYAEAANFLGWPGRLRRYRDRLKYAALGGRIGFVLAVGEIGMDWYRQAGFSADKIFPFAYFADSLSFVAPEQAREDVVEIAYVGQLVHRKGVDVLLDALARVQGLPWRLEILGDGPDRAALERQAGRLALVDRIDFSGVQPYRAILETMRTKDLLVLPSRRDGWGMVVNEALGRGVPVICTTHCGARDLLRDPWRGTIVPAGCVEPLSQALRQHIEHGPPSSDQRKRIAEWCRRISGKAAAAYLLEILAHVYDDAPRPTPPWAPPREHALELSRPAAPPGF